MESKIKQFDFVGVSLDSKSKILELLKSNKEFETFFNSFRNFLFIDMQGKVSSLIFSKSDMITSNINIPRNELDRLRSIFVGTKLLSVSGNTSNLNYMINAHGYLSILCENQKNKRNLDKIAIEKYLQVFLNGLVTKSEYTESIKEDIFKIIDKNTEKAIKNLNEENQKEI